MDIKKAQYLFVRLKSLIDTEINLLDTKGYIILSTDGQMIGNYDLNLNNMNLNKPFSSIKGYIYSFIEDENSNNFIISIRGDTSTNKNFLKIIKIFFDKNIASMSKHDFIKELILGNVESDEILNFCEQFEIPTASNFQVMLIKFKEDVFYILEDILLNMFEDSLLIKLNKFTYGFIYINPQNIAANIAFEINNLILSELLYEPQIGVGPIVKNVRYLPSSFEKAKLCIELGTTFLNDKKIYLYDELLLPLLIKNCQPRLIKDLTNDSSHNLNQILLDSELLVTIIEFFENNLNISETARRLYIHRNTLVYRLNKIQKITGLDLRNFKDATNFKILMSMDNYLKKIENNNQIPFQ